MSWIRFSADKVCVIASDRLRRWRWRFRTSLPELLKFTQSLSVPKYPALLIVEAEWESRVADERRGDWAACIDSVLAKVFLSPSPPV